MTSTNKQVREDAKAFVSTFESVFMRNADDGSFVYDRSDLHDIYIFVSGHKAYIELVTGVYLTDTDYKFSYDDDDEVNQAKLRSVYKLCFVVAERMRSL